MTTPPLDNGATTPLSTYPSLLCSPQIDTPEYPDTPPPRLCIDTSVSDRLASEGDLLGFRLTGAADALFGVYQYWVNQNPSIHLDGG